MHVSRRTLLTGLAASAAGLAFGQSFPSKPIRIIVPFPPASNPDVLARLVGDAVGARLKQAVVVENKAGAGGMIGTDAAAKAAADGHTVLVGDTGPLSIAPWLYAKVPYAPTKDLTGVASLVGVPLVLVASRTASFATFAEFIAQARANPGKMMYGSLGVGSIHHLTAERLNASQELKLEHVAYKSNAELATAVINGDVQVAFSGIPSIEGFIKEGRLRALGISTLQRSKALPDVKTFHEQGAQDFDASSSIGIAAPAGVPPDRLKLLEEACLAAMKDPRLLDRIDGLGMLPRPAGGAAYQATIASELERFGRVVKAANIQPQ